jgi:hypothetical protein
MAVGGETENRARLDLASVSVTSGGDRQGTSPTSEGPKMATPIWKRSEIGSTVTRVLGSGRAPSAMHMDGDAILTKRYIE